MSPTLHDNVVTINDISNEITSISYVTGSLVITEGQPSEVPPTISSAEGVYTITLKAGREDSASVATAFNNQCGGIAKEFAPDTATTPITDEIPINLAGAPDKLNFMFAVSLSFRTGGSAKIYLAQGHFDELINNWWIGGDPIFSVQIPRLLHTVQDKIYTFVMSGTHDSFDLRLANTRPVSPIQHVFVPMLENHSFDNMLALSGIPGLKVANTGNANKYNDVSYFVQGNAPGSMPTDPGHEFTDVLEQLAGKQAVYPPHGQYPRITGSGFASNYATTTTEGPAPSQADIGDIMKCFDTQQQLPVMYQLATQFVVCDQWFSSLPGPTWPNRFFLHGASSNGLDHSPTNGEIRHWEEKLHGFEYPHGSIFDAMTAGGITWGVYQDFDGPLEGSIPQVTSIKNVSIFGIHELSSLEKDVKSTSYPYQYTFIEPNYGDIVNGTYDGGTSQHPMDGVGGGEGLIAKVYGLIRNSPLWPSSLLIITYDEHGGFYDHYAPGPAQPPDDGSSDELSRYGFTFAQYGVRVPALIISPLLPKGVDHTIYDHSSVLATLERLFNLPHLTKRDAAANVIKNLPSPSTPLGTDVPANLHPPAPQPQKRILSGQERAARELEPVPDGSTLGGFLGVLLKADSELSATPADRTAALSRFQSIKTRGDARAYIHEVMGKVNTEKAKRGL